MCVFIENVVFCFVELCDVRLVCVLLDLFSILAGFGVLICAIKFFLCAWVCLSSTGLSLLGIFSFVNSFKVRVLRNCMYFVCTFQRKHLVVFGFRDGFGRRIL